MKKIKTYLKIDEKRKEITNQQAKNEDQEPPTLDCQNPTLMS